MLRSLALFVAMLIPSLAHAKIVTQKIEYKDGETVLEGFLAYDDTKDETQKRPGVLVCHEWWGGGGSNDYAQARAIKLAELGYVAFSLDMYGKGRNTSDPKQAGAWAGEVMGTPGLLQRRAAAGLKVLVQQPQVDPKRLAAIGYCMGGTVALELARSGLPHTGELRAIVAFHASTVAAKGSDMEIAKANGNLKGSVLVCHGAIDDFVKPGELETFQKQMEAAKVDYQVVHYAGAVHAFTNPKADDYKLPSVGYNQAADRRSFEHMQRLFVERLN